MLLRFDPFAEFERMTKNHEVGNGFMAADGYRTDDTFVISLDLPGVNQDSIDLTVERNDLMVSVERRWERGDDMDVVMQERPVGTFTRRFFLGENLDADRIRAEYEAGVLTIAIPVREQAKARKITVGSGEKALTG